MNGSNKIKRKINVGKAITGIQVKKKNFENRCGKLYNYGKRDHIHLCNFNDAFSACKLRKLQLLYLTAREHANSRVQNHSEVHP
jgi:hypothetical protein